MDGSQMATASKKRGPIEVKRGRPAKGSLSTFSCEIAKAIRDFRKKHEGWGAVSIRVELQEELGYRSEELPSTASINRWLKAEGFIKPATPSRPLPGSKECKKSPKRPHDRWEMDAQGAVEVKGLRHQAIINVKDVKSKIHCMAFPVGVKHQQAQASAKYYYWTLRLAFEQWGLPKTIQVDKDSVFYENTSNSPFPKTFHLWLLSLGVELCFIKKPPPQENAVVERSHQTMERQVLSGQSYDYWKQLLLCCDERRKRLNEKMPNRMLNQKAPLEAFPNAAHSGRNYSIAEEEALISLKPVYRFLARCTWYRKVSKGKMISLGGFRYYLKSATPYSQVQIRFCNRSKKLVFRDVNEQILAKCPIKNLTKEFLMGATNKQLVSMKYQIYHLRNCPL
jgi:hypothetical protein